MKQATKKNSKIIELGNGDYVLTKGISPIMVDQVMAMVKDPPVPVTILENDAGGKEEYPNPNDPEYIRQLAERQQMRERRTLHAIVAFGMILCDENGNPVDPPSDGWEVRLRMAGVDWKREIEAITGELSDDDIRHARASAYIMFVAITADDMPQVMALAGADEVEQQKAAATFRGEA